MNKLSTGYKTGNFKRDIVQDEHPVEKSRPNLHPKKRLNPDTKVQNNLANISHKNTCGANNWQKFLESQSNENSNKPNHILSKQRTRPKHINTSLKQNFPYAKPMIDVDQDTDLNKLNSTISEVKSKPEMQNKFMFHAQNDKSSIKPNTNRDLHKTDRLSSNKPRLTKQVAMDCEMVGVEVGVNGNILARVSLVNAEGDCIYDKYVKPSEPILDYRTSVSGIRPENIENAQDFKTVQKEVADIINGRVLVGHALKNDLRVLFLTHPKHLIRDTSKFKKFRVGATPALKKLAKKFLGVTIQEGEHSSVQDALAAMQLYRMFRKEWEGNFHKKIGPHLTQKVKVQSVTSVDV